MSNYPALAIAQRPECVDVLLRFCVFPVAKHVVTFGRRRSGAPDSQWSSSQSMGREEPNGKRGAGMSYVREVVRVVITEV